MKQRVLLFALLLPVFAACGSDDKTSDAAVSTPAATTPAAANTTGAPPVADTAVETTVAAGPTGTTPAGAIAVAIADFKFVPPTVNVAVGGSVVWTNNDTQQHTATSAGNFDAGAIEPGASMSVEFETAGSFTYICSFHPFMTGTVVVG
jgi:plastocyanin